MNKDLKCCFCKETLTNFGNSTYPIFDRKNELTKRCCDECNLKYVIPSRLSNNELIRIQKLFKINS